MIVIMISTCMRLFEKYPGLKVVLFLEKKNKTKQNKSKNKNKTKNRRYNSSASKTNK